MYYLNVFLLFSIFGHLFETVYFFIINVEHNSGFMYLWWTPIYGIGTLLTWLIYKFISKYVDNKVIRNIILFVIYLVGFSILEFIGGHLLELIYDQYFWNYYKYPLNIGRYVSLFISLIWTILAFTYIYFLKKYSDKLINKIPKFVTIILLVIFVVDLFFSIIKVF